MGCLSFYMGTNWHHFTEVKGLSSEKTGVMPSNIKLLFLNEHLSFIIEVKIQSKSFCSYRFKVQQNMKYLLQIPDHFFMSQFSKLILLNRKYLSLYLHFVLFPFLFLFLLHTVTFIAT